MLLFKEEEKAYDFLYMETSLINTVPTILEEVVSQDTAI